MEKLQEKIEAQDFGFFSKIVATKVGIGKDTLRTWSLKLEAEGVEFERNERNQRIYYQKDVIMLDNMKELVGLGHPLNEVAKIVAEKFSSGAYMAPHKEKNAENTLAVSHTENELITQEERLAVLKLELLSDFQQAQKAELERFKNEIAMEMAEVMQDRMEEAVKIALLRERKAMAKEIAAEIMTAQAEIAADMTAQGEKQKNEGKKSLWKRIFG